MAGYSLRPRRPAASSSAPPNTSAPGRRRGRGPPNRPSSPHTPSPIASKSKATTSLTHSPKLARTGHGHTTGPYLGVSPAAASRPGHISISTTPNPLTRNATDDECSPAVAVRFDLQAEHNTCPQRFQLALFPGYLPAQGTLCVHVHTPDDVPWHAEPVVSTATKRALPEAFDRQGCLHRPWKRARAYRQGARQRSAPPESRCSVPLQLDNVSSRASDSWPENQPSRPPSLSSTSTPTCLPAIIQLATSSFIIIVIILVFGLILVIAVVFLSASQVHLVKVISRHRPTYAAVDWNQQAVQMEIGLTSIPRVILFGETSQVSTGWLNSPGLRPEAGILHERTNFDYDFLVTPPRVDPRFFSNSTFFQPCSPYESTSTGVYVPAQIFFWELQRVTETLMHDLQLIANHGPSGFFFTSGSSSQFRWSTSGTAFLPPHDTLPTVPSKSLLRFKTAPTLHGVPPVTKVTYGSAQYPSPTARPPRVQDIANLDSRLAQLQTDLWKLLSEIINRREEDALSLGYFTISIIRAEQVAAELGKLYDLQMGENRTWGSDEDRIAFLRAQRKPSITVLSRDQDQPVATPRSIDKSIPSDVPPDFVRSWDDYMKSRQTQDEPRISRPTATSTFNPTFTPSIQQFIQLQSRNLTASDTLQIIDPIIHRPLNKTVSYFDNDPTYGEIKAYAQQLERLSSYLADLDQRISQILFEIKPDMFKHNHYSKQLSVAFRRLRHAQSFISDIARTRVKDLRRRAYRGVLLLEKVQEQQAALQDEIATVQAHGWTSPSGESYHHLPCLADLARDWAFARRWLVAEAEDVYTLWYSRRAEILEQQDLGDGDIIWSRWNLTDRRRDPGGSEAFRWDEYNDRLQS